MSTSQSQGVVWVAGVGASAGLGGALARRFAKAGFTTAITGRSAERLVDGGIDGEQLRTRAADRVAQAGLDGLLNLEAIAEVYFQLHLQHRSAWTQELDLRPFKEPF